MLNGSKLRQLYESYVNDPTRAGGAGRYGFVVHVRHMLGLCDAEGNDYRDRAGNRRIQEAQLQAEEFDLGDLGFALIGHDFKRYFDPTNPGSLSGVASFRMLTEAANPGDGRALLESTGVGIDVSAFANINAWTAVTGGLLERRLLEGFYNPQFIADELMPAESTRMKEGQKVIGVSRIGDKGKERQPGQPHERAGFGERWVTLPSTRENSLAIDVTKEAVFFDLTGGILEEASQVGEWLAYRKEIEVIDAFIGVTSQSGGRVAFNYKGTAYDTYSPTRVNGYLNQQANELIDWTSFEASWLLFQRMEDPHTGTRILAMPDTVLVNPGKVATAEMIVGASAMERRTAGSATQATAGTLNVSQGSANPVSRFGVKKVLFSPLVEQRCTDASGLALTPTNATKYWWHFQQGRVFKYMQNWPLTVAQAPANNYEMLDRGLVASYFANERGTPSVHSPWHGARNTN